MTGEFGFDLASDLLSLAPSSSPLPSLSPTTRGFTTRGISTTGSEFLLSLPLSVDETLARAHASGRPLRFGKPEFYVWKIRLAVERGIVRPHRVLTVALTGPSFPKVKVWAGFVLLVGCKWLYDPGAPTVFTREFAAPWSDVTVDQARGAITALKQAGYMLPVGKHGSMTLWLPKGRA